MIRPCLFSLIAIATAQPIVAATLRVPQEHKTIAAAIRASSCGDTILVTPGHYSERIRLKQGITLRSDGNDDRGMKGLKRAEATVLDGGGKGTLPGVLMASGSALDGFTVTHVGVFDDARWKEHFDSHGEELGDDEGSVQAEGTTPAIFIQGVSCNVTNCIVHHNGDVGIGILGKDEADSSPLIAGNIVYRNMGGGIGVAEGAEPIIRGNVCSENLRAGIGCRNADPLITKNQCFQNIRAGIGCREGSKPVIRGNKCYQNRRAGIGIRMKGTAPIVEENECDENDLAGIGCRDEARPILRNNICRKNKTAGIGCDGASPLVLGNKCAQNLQAGIGVQGQVIAIIHQNDCHENKLVAIGITGGSTAIIMGNDLARTGGAPPIIAVKDVSTATIRNNHISGGGVAAVLVQGKATVCGNTFTGIGTKQGNAVWVREGAVATILENSFDGYRVAVNATKADVTIAENRASGFQRTAIIVKESSAPANVYGNIGISTNPQAKVVDLQGALGIVEENLLKSE